MEVLVILIFVASVRSLYLPEEKSPAIKNDTTEEIQHAVCKISSNDLEATANATVSSNDLEATANATVFRELRGVCTSVELETNINDIKKTIIEEIQQIKNILRENGFNFPKLQYDSSKLSRSEIRENGNENVKMKSIREINSSMSRLEEISIYNNTAVDSNKGGIFFYYWSIGNIQSVLTKRKMYISSPIFHILGHSLHLQFYPNYLDEEYFGIQLKPSSKGFIKKHKIYIINQIDKSLDIDSGLMFGFKEESLFRVSRDDIKKSGYIVDFSLIVKVEIYLNS